MLAKAPSITAMQTSSGNLLCQWKSCALEVGSWLQVCACCVGGWGHTHRSDHTDSALPTWILGSHVQFLKGTYYRPGGILKRLTCTDVSIHK